MPKRKANSTSKWTVKKVRKTKKATTLATAVKKIIKGVMEPKHFTFATSISTPASGTFISLNLLGNIVQGTSISQREGDEILIEAIKLRFSFFEGNYVNNGAWTTVYRVMVIRSAKEVQTTATSFVAGNFTSADLFQAGNTYIGADGIVDPKLITVLADKVVYVKPQWAYGVDVTVAGTGGTNSTERQLQTIMVPMTIKRSFKMSYKHGTNYATAGKHNTYILVLPYNGNGGGSSDTGAVNLVGDVIYKELQ